MKGLITMSKKSKIIGIICLLLLTTPFIGYFIAKTSDPFQHARDVVFHSTVVRENLGEVISIKLAPFGYGVKYSGTQGEANFEIEVTGAERNGTLFVNLERDLGVWDIVGARLNGKKVKL